ncbi:MAG: UDP-N-acetylmuramate dehydrogenase [Deltaproteobacteria bacterium]|nr:MAG: UDP-N-acetylmuramate dehydrogenase [Deltaproteobacteria bacterium]
MTKGAEIAARLDLAGAGLEDTDVRLDEPMARHTTNRLGGPADVFVRPGTERDLAVLLARAHGTGVPVTFVGSGTNLLVRDGGIRGLVVNLGRMRRVERPDPDGRPGHVFAEAGASTGRVLARCRSWGLSGVEFLAGVPGSMGGGVVMNAGTFLGEFRDVVTRVTSLTLDGRRVVRPAAACGFRYRGSDLPPDEVVVSMDLDLAPADTATIDAAVERLRSHRRAREPQGVPNNGSTFKNPPGDHAGRLIEAAGLKGLRVGGAVVSPVHANWLVVDPDAGRPCTATDMIALIERVRDEVAARFGVTLELEVRVLGED